MPSFAERAIGIIASDYTVDENRIRLAMADAERKGLAGVLMMPLSVPVARADRRGVTVMAACGYPAGCQPAAGKALEVKQADEAGAGRVFVMPLNGNVLDGALDKLDAELRAVRAATNKPITLIVEWAVFEPQQAKTLCEHALACGIKSFATSAAFQYNSVFDAKDPFAMAQFVHTTEPDTVATLRGWLGADAELVAAEADLTRDKAEALLAAGADLVASASIFKIA